MYSIWDGSMLLFVASIMHRLLRKKLMPVRSGGASRRAVPQGEEKSLYSLFYLGFVLIIVWSTDLQSYNFLIKVMP